jgi:RNA polymerase sigma-70 factor (ECF subfamily)
MTAADHAREEPADRLLDDFLVAAARDGERAAFDRLAERWERRLVRHAWRLTGDADAARDVAQDAWVDIARGLVRLDDSRAFPAFALRIVTRRAADHVRRARSRRAGEARIAAEPPPHDLAAETMETLATRGPVASAIASLPPEQRAAIALFYLEELTVAEIAVALDAPAGTVKTRLKAAREKLKLALEPAKKEKTHEQA